ncbi:MAG TPA: DUF3536 domain-containing protein, partial [Thermoanaerobaculia bacterium]|nr:DUF3536 domain-containing protein [Thermoanaerobaculia bacterium]
MALAYALQYIDQNELAKITNYGEHLALHPPETTVDIVENTAWSCAHGIERWRSDCGCSTGGGSGWNQQWRGPLRSALDWLRGRATAIYELHGADVLRDPWSARDEYIDVILDRSDECVHGFITKHANGGAHVTTVLELMEMQRNAMLMYTSCGWFFNDVSGIETVQVLQYAARVVQLAEQLSGERIEPELLERLALAQSNLPDRGNARQIYEREVLPTRLDLRRVAAHFAVASLFDHFDDDARVYSYDVHRHDFEIHKAGRARMAIASITVRSRITLAEESFELAVLHLGETELTGGVRATRGDYNDAKRELVDAMEPGGIPAVIRLLDQHFNETPVSIRSLFRDEQRRILHGLCNATLEEAESAFRQLHERYDPLLRFHTRLGIPVPKVLQTAAEFDLNVQLRRLLNDETPAIAEIEARLRQARDEQVTLDETTRLAFQSAIARASQRFAEHAEDLDRLELYVEIVEVVRTNRIEIDLRAAQTTYYRMKESVRPVITDPRWLEWFDALGGKLSISSQ